MIELVLTLCAMLLGACAYITGEAMAEYQNSQDEQPADLSKEEQYWRDLCKIEQKY